MGEGLPGWGRGYQDGGGATRMEVVTDYFIHSEK